MTTKELIQQYVTAHADNRWMDASELETLLTEFAEKLQEPVSEDLAVAVREQMEYDGDVDDFVRRGIDDIALKYATLGAQWHNEQFEKNRLIACDKQTKEEAEVESDFVMGIIENEHRQPTFDDAIKYGMMLQKEQMMKDVVDGEVNIWCSHISLPKMLPSEFSKQRVKVIIIKE